MPWSGSTYTRSNGTYTGASVWASDAAAGVKIVTDRHDTHDQDLATAINACLKNDGGNAATANIPMGGYKLTGLGNGTASGDALHFGQFAFSTWVPTFTGFSADPASPVCYYLKINKLVVATVAMQNNGTSNATSFTMTAPAASVSRSGMVWTAAALVTDAGTVQTTPGRVYLPNNSSTITIYKDFASGTWTNSGAKGAYFVLVYEAA